MQAQTAQRQDPLCGETPAGKIGRKLVVTAVCEFAVSSCDELSPMITGDLDRAITFTVADRAATDHQFEDAVAVMQERAMAQGRGGIPDTRQSRKLYSAKLSDAVPFGLTLEHHNSRK
jgi:predicted RecB family endonuclease